MQNKSSIFTFTSYRMKEWVKDLSIYIIRLSSSSDINQLLYYNQNYLLSLFKINNYIKCLLSEKVYVTTKTMHSKTVPFTCISNILVCYSNMKSWVLFPIEGYASYFIYYLLFSFMLFIYWTHKDNTTKINCCVHLSQNRCLL